MIVLRDDWQDQAAWDRFVDDNEEGRFCQLYGYGRVTRCYGYRTRSIGFLKGDELVALIPIAEIGNSLFGRKLISQPFSEYGGLLVAKTLSVEDVASIVRLLRDHLAGKYGGTALEMHGNHGLPPDVSQRLFVSRNPHLIAYLKLDRPEGEIWKDVISYEARKAVNKALRTGLTVREERTEALMREEFFPLYLMSMKRLGVPPHKLDYYLNCYREFGERMRIFWAFKGPMRIAALLGFSSGRRVSLVNTVSNPSYWEYRPNDLLHWEFIKFAIERGLSYFDFGSVRYEGQQRFKSKWRCTLAEQHYYFLTNADSQVRTFDSSSSLMQRFSGVWANYVPDALAVRLGPAIRRRLAR